MSTSAFKRHLPTIPLFRAQLAVIIAINHCTANLILKTLVASILMKKSHSMKRQQQQQQQQQQQLNSNSSLHKLDNINQTLFIIFFTGLVTYIFQNIVE